MIENVGTSKKESKKEDKTMKNTLDEDSIGKKQSLTMSRDKFKCNIDDCNKAFLTKNTLNLHITSHVISIITFLKRSE